MEMVNGYVFLDLTKSNVYSKALKVLGADKPVVIKDGSGSPYFVDSLTLDGTNIIITKGGKTITIANNNTITNVGDIQNHLYALSLIYNEHYCYTFFVNKLSGLNNKNITSYDEEISIILTENEIKSLYNSLLTALTDNENYIICNMSIIGANELSDMSFNISKIDNNIIDINIINENDGECSLIFKINSNGTITDYTFGSDNDVIVTIKEKQLF